MICKNKDCRKEFDYRWKWQVFCSKSCYRHHWNMHTKKKLQHKFEEMSNEIERLKRLSNEQGQPTEIPLPVVM